MLSKIISRIKTWQTEIVLATAIILITIISFESGKISASRNFGKPLEIKYEQATISKIQSPTLKNTANPPDSVKSDFQVVASKNSTIYHFLWCSGAKRIKEENKITFSSEQEAQSKGYTLASNCQR